MKKKQLLLFGLLTILLSSQLSGQTSSFFEDFNGVSVPLMPEGWTVIKETTSATAFVRTSTDFSPFSPPNQVRFYNVTDANATLVLVSPEVNNFDTNWLTFYTKMTAPDHTSNLYVGVLSDPDDYDTFTAVDTIVVSGDEHTYYNVFFPDYGDDDAYHIGFSFDAPAMIRNLLIDNIMWDAAPAGPVLSFAPEDGDLSWVDVNGTRSSSYDILNAGVGVLTIGEEDVVFTGADADAFSVAGDFPIELTANASESIEVVFSPTEVGDHEAVLEISYNGVDSPYTLSFSGTSLGAVSEYFEDFDASLSFPQGWTGIPADFTQFDPSVQVYGGTAYSDPNSVRFRNQSVLDADMILSGPLVSDFEDNWLTFYARANFASHEEPVAIGVMTDRFDADSFIGLDTLTVSGNVYSLYSYVFPEEYSNDDSHVVALKFLPEFATRVLYVDDILWGPRPDVAEFTITPEEGAFGQVYLGETSSPISFVLSNVGFGDLTIATAEDIFIAGMDSDYFDLMLPDEVSFPVVLETGDQFVVDVTFSPLSEGDYLATLTIVDNLDAKATREVPLTGEGFDPTVTPDVLFDFTGDFPPADWQRYTGALVEDTELTPSTLGWVHGVFGHDGAENNSARINRLWGANKHFWLVTPPIDLTDDGMEYLLEFDLALTGAGTSSSASFGDDQRFAVVISTDGGETWSSDNLLQQWDSDDEISHTGDQMSIDLTGYEGVVQLGFYAESLSGGFFDGIDVFFTNVEVKEKMTFDAEFIVDDEAGDPIENAIITLNDTEYPAGQYLIDDLLTGTYDYTVSKGGYVDVSGDFSIVDQDVTINVTMILDAPFYTLTFVVEDEDGVAVTDAVIALNGMENDPGDYVFEDLESDTYTYTVNRVGYEEASGSVTITDEDLTVEVVLEASPTYTLTFVIEDVDGELLDDAVIKLDGTTYDAGVYVFEDLMAGIYAYQVSLEGYFDESGDAEIIDEDVTVTIVLEEVPYTLNLTVDPANSGTVTGAGDYLAGTEVDIEALANEGYEFINWTDEDDNVVSGDAETTFIMPESNTTLTANFALIDYALTIHIDPENAGTATGEGSYNMDDQVTVEATAAEGYEFVSWTDQDGNEVSVDTEYTFTMPADDVVLTAHFDPLPFDLSLSVSPEGTGIAEGEGIYLFGEEVLIEASPETGYVFVNWTDDDGNEFADSAEYSFNMPAQDLSLTANFEMEEYTLSLLVAPEGSGEVSGAGSYNMGDMVVINATPNEGYEFVSWTDEDGDVISTSPSESVTMPAGDLTITANFEAISYTLSLSAEPETGGALSGEGMYFFGEEVSVIAEANEDYEFENWTDENGVELSLEAEYNFIMPSEDLHLVAHFQNVTSIHEPIKPAILVYPNPANQYLNIESSETLMRVRVYNIAGQLVIDKTTSSNEMQLQVQSLENGLYVVRLYYESGIVIKRFEIIR